MKEESRTLESGSPRLDLDDVGGLKALGALDHFEFDGRAFLEIAISVSLDGGIVDKNVLTLAALDEAVTLCGVEPLDSSLFSIAAHFYFCSFKFDAVCSPSPQAENKKAASATRSLSLRRKRYYKSNKRD
jgi:hypothetical protein